MLMFFSKCSLCIYAHDNILYSTGKDLNRIRRNLKNDFMILYQWFHENHMTLTPGKCHYMVIGGRDLSHEIMLSNSKIIRYLSRHPTNFSKSYRLPLQKSKPINKCLSQVKELPYIRSKKLTTTWYCHKVSVYLLPYDKDVYGTLSK